MTHRSALVAGGAGFLGSHLCDSLVDDGYDVVCVDNVGSGRRENVEHLLDEDGFDFVEGDVRSPDSMPETGVDVVYHLASRASPDDFSTHPVEIASTNGEGTRTLLEYAREHDSTFLFASTSEVYGDPTVSPQPETYNGNVNIRGVRGCYDESKRYGEALTVAYARQHGVDTRTVRIFNTYGPRMREDDGRVVSTFVSQALADEDITVYGDGSQTRSFCYVSDLIEGIRSLADSTAAAGDAVNIGSEREISIRRLAEIVRDVCDSESDIVHEPLPEDDPQQRRPDTAKARDLLGWEPTVSLEDGLERTADHFR